MLALTSGGVQGMVMYNEEGVMLLRQTVCTSATSIPIGLERELQGAQAYISLVRACRPSSCGNFVLHVQQTPNSGSA